MIIRVSMCRQSYNFFDINTPKGVQDYRTPFGIGC